MNYFTEINGLPIQASYTQKIITKVSSQKSFCQIFFQIREKIVKFWIWPSFLGVEKIGKKRPESLDS